MARQVAWMIYEYSKGSDTDESVLDFKLKRGRSVLINVVHFGDMRFPNVEKQTTEHMCALFIDTLGFFCNMQMYVYIYTYCIFKPSCFFDRPRKLGHFQELFLVLFFSKSGLSETPTGLILTGKGSPFWSRTPGIAITSRKLPMLSCGGADRRTDITASGADLDACAVGRASIAGVLHKFGWRQCGESRFIRVQFTVGRTTPSRSCRPCFVVKESGSCSRKEEMDRSRVGWMSLLCLYWRLHSDDVCNSRHLIFIHQVMQRPFISAVLCFGPAQNEASDTWKIKYQSRRSCAYEGTSNFTRTRCFGQPLGETCSTPCN